MVCKRVLLAFGQQLSHLREAVLDYGRGAGWRTERFPVPVPDGWDGDGVITDVTSWDKLERLRDSSTIPVVCCRNVEARGNVRFVFGDTRAIAGIAADFFLARGFRNFITFSTHPPINGAAEAVAAVVPDHALRLELERRGLSARMFNVFETPEEVEAYDFRGAVGRLRRFLRSAEKPCACFTSSVNNAPLFHRACDEEGIKVPQEIAFLVNNDEPSITEHTRPTTSAVVGEIRGLGLRMAETLAAMMAGEAVPPEPLLIKPSGIVARQSTDILAVPDLKAAQAINFLLTNYMNPISVRDAADHAGLHPDMMNYLFRKHIDKSPGRLLRDIRMGQARELLAGTALNLGEIARRVGYGSAMAFSLAFKRECGELPGAYREKRSAKP